MSIRIKIEPVKSKKVFNDFVKGHKFEFAGMSVSDSEKSHTQYLMCICDEPITETVKDALQSIDAAYILYSGKAYGKFCVAVEIKY
ncbi:MAG: hypothetical protein IJD78_09500 [Clostridia bacterium]|nr:hypothetical protein [Clostridia bacterium]